MNPNFSADFHKDRRFGADDEVHVLLTLSNFNFSNHDSAVFQKRPKKFKRL